MPTKFDPTTSPRPRGRSMAAIIRANLPPESHLDRPLGWPKHWEGKTWERAGSTRGCRLLVKLTEAELLACWHALGRSEAAAQRALGLLPSPAPEYDDKFNLAMRLLRNHGLAAQAHPKPGVKLVRWCQREP